MGVGFDKDIRLFGEFIGHPALADVVLELFKSAVAQSTKKTYKTGRNRFKKFLEDCMLLPSKPFFPRTLSLKGIMLCFFIGSLFTEVRQLSCSTIKNYVCHVKAAWIAEGGILSDFGTKIVKSMLRGVKRLRPPGRDGRAAFILPHYSLPFFFLSPSNFHQ